MLEIILKIRYFEKWLSKSLKKVNLLMDKIMENKQSLE